MRKQTNRQRSVILLHACGIGLFLPVPATADATWNPAMPDGSWSNPANWLGGVVPEIGNATIEFDDSLGHTVVYDDFLFHGTDFHLQNKGGGDATIVFNGAQPFIVRSMTIADTGRGTAVQTGNYINTAPNDATLIVGNTALSAGTFIQAGGTTEFSSVIVANASFSTGTLIVTGGVMSPAIVGNQGSGTLLISGGTMAGGIVGNLGSGTVIQTGGDLGGPTLGALPGGSGTYELIDGIGGADVGGAGTGLFIQTGGIGGAAVGVLPGGVGTYNLLGGSSRGMTIGVGGVGVVNQSGGTSNGNIVVGSKGTGTYNFSGGTVNARSISVGDSDGGHGTFLMNAPLLTAGSIGIGAYGTGYFEQNGGSVIVGTGATQGTLQLGNDGGTGTYLLNSGLLQAGTEQYSYLSRATTAFIQNAGINQTGSLITGFGNTYALNAGSLVISNWEAMFGALLQSGGVHSVGTPAQPARLGAGNITQTGGEFDVYGVEGDLGLTVHTGGVHNVGTESAPATIILGQSNFFGSIPPDVYQLSGNGRLNVVGIERLGYTHEGTPPLVSDAGQFNQSGGTHTLGTESVPGQLILQGNGTNSGERGEYLLSGGVLKVIGDEHIGVVGFGRITQSGGRHTLGTASVPGNLHLGEGTGRGVYALSGGTLDVTGIEWVGYNGSATFRQSGGWHSLIGTMSIGNAGTNGIYTMTGGTASLANVYVGGSPSGAGVAGTLSVATGSSLSVPGMLKIWPTGTIIYSGGSVSAGSLEVTGGEVLLTPGADKVLHVHSVTTSSGGIIDLADNSLVVDYGSPLSFAPSIVNSPIDDLVTQLGSGIITSVSATNPNKRLGYFDDGSKITVLLVLGGDSNLDGIVNMADLQLLDDHWQQPGYWGGGDFDYTKFVDIQDLYILAPNWNDPTPLSDALASLGLPQVPEPASLLGIVVFALTRRRTRRC